VHEALIAETRGLVPLVPTVGPGHFRPKRVDQIINGPGDNDDVITVGPKE